MKSKVRSNPPNLQISPFFKVSVVFLILSMGHNALYAQPAFPGAEGFGTQTPGGRGGRVIFVTNLNPDGPGSLREACEAKGPRIVVFRVGGTIVTEEDIPVTEPFITIAGQTAPGDGVCIRGAALSIFTHDVIVRGLRIRVGDGPGPDGNERDAIKINNRETPPHNIVIDRCSFSWGLDETVQLWYPCHNVTVQWCIVSESLFNNTRFPGGAGAGFIIGDHAKNVSVHHNLMAHNNGRNPLMKQNSFSEVINNVVYNWGTWEATGISNWENRNYPIVANIIANYYKPGPDKSTRSPVYLHRQANLRDGTRIHVKDNIGPGRMTGVEDDWAVVTGDEKWRSLAPAMPLSGIRTTSANMAYEEVLKYAGAVVPRHDAVDQRIIGDVQNSTGKIISSQVEVGGWPDYHTAAPPQDSDDDGMPDWWEEKNGLNKNDPSDANGYTISNLGYTNIEVYINGLIEQVTAK